MPPCSPPLFDSSSLEVPSAVHHAVWMSSRRLPVIIFVSFIEFMIMFMLVLCGVHSVAGGFFLHHMRAMTRLPLRLLQSSVLLLPP